MTGFFSINEVVEIGIQIEDNGRLFYDRLAEKIVNLKAKEVFDFLAREEEKHQEYFQSLLTKVESYQPQEAYPGEYMAYLRALSAHHVFIGEAVGGKLADQTKNDSEALAIGIQAEQESILFFQGMKKVIMPAEHGILDEIIAQEEGHLIKLTDLQQAV